MNCYLPRRRNGLRLATSIALCLVLGTQAALAQSPLSLERAVAEAAGRSQLVIAADAQTRTARETAAAAGQLPDPVLKLGLNNLPIDGPDRYSVTRDFMTMRSVGVMQELTRADKRNARVRRAEREIELTQVNRQATIADLQRDTALAWLERSYQESMCELLQSQIAQAELQVQAAETLYRSGKGSQAEVFAARGSVEQLRDGLAQVERRVAVAITQLGRWVGESAWQPLAPRAALTLPAWTEGALPQHLSQHPQIAAAAQQEAIADSEAAMARAAKSSDWSVELQYSQRGPAYSNMVSINLSVPLQWDQKNRQDRELAARLAGVDEARARREELQRAHEAEVRAMLQEWRSHDERLGRYDATLLPLATQRSEAALAAYRAGSGPLTAVLDARRSEIDVRAERLRIEMDRARIWAQLNYLLPSHDGAHGKPEAAQ
jgi:outer membrane protein TolC